jgi:hypothetical protein
VSVESTASFILAILFHDPLEVIKISMRCANIHGQVRQDLLTVREIARLQGFRDDFIFHGTKMAQYNDVLTAQPPAIAKAIANVISDAISISRKREIADFVDNTRANKRTRDSFEDIGLVQ